MDKLEFYDQLNYLKAGIAYSGLVTTVSPTYAQQIQSSPEFGAGLEGFLRGRTKDFSGVLNGLDIEEWNPEKDPFLPKNFDSDKLSGRKDCKTFLQTSLKLPVSAEAPVLGMVARLDSQKGMDLLAAVLPEVVAKGAQTVILGQGDSRLQGLLERYEKEFPSAVRMRSDFNEPLAHHIYAGSDMFLMPSRFEPCGLGQLIAMRYGAVPVAANTGGLRDTITPFSGNDSGTGFLFQAGSAPALAAAISEALGTFKDRTLWTNLQRRGMTANFSWDRSADTYLSLYRRALGRSNPTRSSSRIQ